MNLSICIITKNEELNIEKCLKQLSGYGFELVVVDTGSTDQTPKIASQYTDKIFNFVWCEDFAKAKNFAVSKASNEMVMVIDSDEFLEQIDLAGLERLIKENPQKVGRICRRNLVLQQGNQMQSIERINRIFSKNQYEYQGKIHEQLVRKDGKAYETYLAPVEIEHAGYFLSEEERKRKALRNLTLLQNELEEKGEDPYILYQLGKSCSFMEDYEKACEYYAKALSFDLDPALEYVIDMVDAYGYALINANHAEQALFFENIEPEFGKSSDFQFLMGLIYMKNALFEESIQAFQKAIKLKKSKMVGTDSYLAAYNIGVVYECLDDVDNAMKFYSQCGKYLPAIKRIGAYLEAKNPKQAFLFYQQQIYEGDYFSHEEREWLKQKQQEQASKFKEKIPKTAIVILSYNTLTETKECIESIRAHCNPKTYRLVVVDNASIDGSVDWLKEQPDIRLQCNQINSGFPGGCNQGIALAEEEDDIWLLNSDTLVPPRALFWLQMGLYEEDKVGAAGSVSNHVSNYQNIIRADLRPDEYLDYAREHHISWTNPYEKKIWMVGFSLLLKRKALGKIGFLDERFSPGNFEDNDIGYRMAEAGYTQLLCKNSFVFHYGSRSFGKKREVFFDLLQKNTQKFKGKWGIDPIHFSYIKSWEASQIKEKDEVSINVLDIGCAMGATMGRIQHQHPKANVIGIEKNAIAANLATQIGTVICADIVELDQQEWQQKFAHILTGGIWEHILDPIPVLHKIKSWLKMGGTISGSNYNRCHVSVVRELEKENPKFEEDGILDKLHVQLYSAEEWLEVLESVGIEVEEFTFKRIHRELTPEEEQTLQELKTQGNTANPMEYEAYQYFWKGHVRR